MKTLLAEQLTYGSAGRLTRPLTMQPSARVKPSKKRVSAYCRKFAWTKN